MKTIVCTRCNNSFHTVSGFNGVTCPYCGFAFKPSGLQRRQEERAGIHRNCRVSDEDMELRCETVDISRGGVGLRLSGRAPYREGKVLHISVEDFEIDTDARVVWVRKYNDTTCRMGLSFIGASQAP